MKPKPLADRLRPKNLGEVVGQQHLLASDKVFRKSMDAAMQENTNASIPNMVFYGPSGCGKTTVARIIAENSGMSLHKLNGTSASTSDIRDVIKETYGFSAQKGVLLYLDEIQYLNKKQQQSLLEHIEDGSITLIASTTENPYFYIYNALLSRCTVFEFKPLQPADVELGLQNALAKIKELDGIDVKAEKGALAQLAIACGGDMRKALNSLDFAVHAAKPQKNGKVELLKNDVKQVAQRSSLRYDKAGDEHYDIVSAYQKSMRGSDPDAALHYLARLLEAGDLMSACRRLLVCANEDVGLAYPQIIPIVKAAVDTALQVGMPEAQIPLANAVIMTAIAPKSNSAYVAIDLAMSDVKKGNIGAIPRQLQNKHFDGADAAVSGQHYIYPHSFDNHWTQQQYLPDILVGSEYYVFGENKTEQSFNKYWQEIKKKP